MKRTQTTMPSQQGFSLLELMVAIAILGFVMAAIAGVFSRTSRLYTTQNAAASLQQEVRAAVEFMAREMRMTGYDPQKTGDFDLEVANATRIRFSSDLNGSGSLDDGLDTPVSSTVAFPRCERLTFRYSSGNNSAQVICGTQPPQTLIGGSDPRVSKVTSLNFEYLGANGTPTSVNSAVRAIVITLTAQAPAGAEGMIERSYSTRVELRNAAANSLI